MAPQTINQQDGQLSHYIQTTNKYGQPVNIPVVDVRDGIAERKLAEHFIKSSNRSRFMNYNAYHISPKKPKSL